MVETHLEENKNEITFLWGDRSLRCDSVYDNKILVPNFISKKRILVPNDLSTKKILIPDHIGTKNIYVHNYICKNWYPNILVLRKY